MFGAALAAPMMPQMGFASTSPQLAAAMAHAKARVSVSAWGLSQSLGVSMAQADTLMADMASRGAIAQIKGGAGRWAMSRVYTPPLPMSVKQIDKKKATDASEPKSFKSITAQDPLMEHLHSLCRNAGLTVRVAA